MADSQLYSAIIACENSISYNSLVHLDGTAQDTVYTGIWYDTSTPSLAITLVDPTAIANAITFMTNVNTEQGIDNNGVALLTSTYTTDMTRSMILSQINRLNGNPVVQLPTTPIDMSSINSSNRTILLILIIIFALMIKCGVMYYNTSYEHKQKRANELRKANDIRRYEDENILGINHNTPVTV